MTLQTTLLAAQAFNPSQIVLPIVMVVVFWVVLIRPQQKRQKEVANKIKALKKNDQVITIGGIHGTVTHVGEKTFSMRIAENVTMKFDKTAVASVNAEKKEKKS